MRILYISGDMGIEVGGRKGASTHIRETCHQLSERGHSVLLLTPCPGDLSDVRVEVRTVALPAAKWLGMDLRYLEMNRRIARVLPRVYREFHPDVVYERYALYQSAGQKFCRRYRLPRILEVNSVLSEEMRSRLKLPLLARAAEQQIWRRERAIICVSSVLKCRILEACEASRDNVSEIVISPVGVDPNIFHPSVPPMDLSRWGISGKKIVGYTGTLTRWHGIDLLFDAAEIMKQRNLDMCFVIVGGEDEKVRTLREKVRKLALEDYLFFLGSLPHSEIPSILTALDAAVIPDTQDWSSPTKYFEMAAAGCAVVAARAPAIEEVTGGNEAGALLFERGNVEEMVTCLEKVCFQPDLAIRLGKQAREHVLRYYSWDCNIARILALYQRMGILLSAKDRELVERCAGELVS